MNKTLDKRPLETTHNTINFLNTIKQLDMQTLGIKDRTIIIIWDRKVIGKHHYVNNVQAKSYQFLSRFNALGIYS